MKLENTFTVPVPRKEAWDVLLDVERVAPCMPGATLTSWDGDSFTGTVKVKVGPINLTYGGKASFVHLDEAAGVAVIEGTGKETRGTGTAKATITCRLLDRGTTTDVAVETELAVTGKPASFGRGVLADVSAKLVDQFAAHLSEEIQHGHAAVAAPAAGATDDRGTDSLAAAAAPAAAPGPAPVTTGATAAGATAAGATAAPSPAVGQPNLGTSDGSRPKASTTAPRAPRKEAEPINLIETAGMPVAKRVVPVLAVLLLVFVLVRRLLR